MANTVLCPEINADRKNRIIAQTLFLGASVNSFNSNMGWGQQPSQLTVNLIDDETICPTFNRQIPDNLVKSPGHYDTCVGNGCYGVINPNTKQMEQYDPTIHNIDQRIIPGKVYYSYNGLAGMQSQYWYTSDPGFFGNGTRISTNGSEVLDTYTKYKYDIVGCPVHFRMQDFNFIGIVQSWNRKLDRGGREYIVNIDSMSSILNSCYVITNKFIGALFSKHSTLGYYGSPKNYLGGNDQKVSYDGNILRGALHNTFNVYGYYESLRPGFFGNTSNDEGMRAIDIISALKIMTSTKNKNTFLNWKPHPTLAKKKAFCQYGRIITKAPMLEYKSVYNPSINYAMITENNTYSSFAQHGFIPIGTSGYPEFSLDLSELLPIHSEFRINNPVISIMELLNILSEECGFDFYIDTVPVWNDSTTTQDFVIKVRTISRLAQPVSNAIENQVKKFECNQYAITANTIGKEKNETNSRAMIIGGQQQRLYQVKSYRLGYSQSNFIFDHNTGDFVNYKQMGKINMAGSVENKADLPYYHGKTRFPNFLTTRNQLLNNSFNSEIYDDEDEMAEDLFFDADNAWSDGGSVVGGPTVRIHGNYLKTSTWSDSIASSTTRWLPIHLDTICPFFGFVNDEEVDIKIADKRRIRPVWLDTWTGQLAVVIKMSELPHTNVNLSAIYQQNYVRNDRCGTTTDQQSLPTLKAKVDNQGNLQITIEDPGTNLIGSPTITITGNNKTFNGTATIANGTIISVTVQGATNLDPQHEYNVEVTLNELPPGSCYTSFETVNNLDFFILTESEMRAALAGFDNFLIYSLSKYYKPDLIEILRRAYLSRTKQQLINSGMDSEAAQFIASQKCNWYWSMSEQSQAIDAEGPKPTIFAADFVDNDNNMSEAALKDLQILHQFVATVARYYGKKYMVTATNLQSYRERSYSGLSLNTDVGAIYAYGGSGKLKYNFEPTNDGAWEEYGNFIDDTIAVGSSKWYNLVDGESGKIKPIIGYNNNEYFDNLRYNICNRLKTNAAILLNNKEKYSEVWDWDMYSTLLDQRYSVCDDQSDFIFPLLDIGGLSKNEFIEVDNITTKNTSPMTLRSVGSKDIGYISGISAKSCDAWGNLVTIKNRKKLYLNTNVDEDIYYLDPDNLRYPKFLVDAPGINFVSSSSKYAQDPNRTVLANSNIEDVAIHLRVTGGNADWSWVWSLLNQTLPWLKIPNYSNWDDIDLGLYSKRANSAAQKIEMAPRVAHPIFAAIPIKSNQYVYGPWTNYPFSEYINDNNRLLPTGEIILQSTGLPPNCTNSITLSDRTNDANVISNWINDISIEYREDFVPWNYGGMSALDAVAGRELQTKINYQPIIETAQVQIPGLPLFNLANSFAYDNLNKYEYVIDNNQEITNIDVKYLSYDFGAYPSTYYRASELAAITEINEPYEPTTPTSTAVNRNFNLMSLKLANNVVYGPVITNINCSMGQNGIATTYSFRTYTRKLGLFNKIENDRARKAFRETLKIRKQMSEINRQLKNAGRLQRKALDDVRLQDIQFGSKDFKTKLMGWSPGAMIIGRASPSIPLYRTPSINEQDFSLQSNPGNFNTVNYSASEYAIPVATGERYVKPDSTTLETDETNITNLNLNSRMRVNVGLYENKEAMGELREQYGQKSAMSLDGLLSPVSFYPTLHYSTFHYGKYDTKKCPFCSGSKYRAVKLTKYKKDGTSNTTTDLVYCDKCVSNEEKLNAKLKSSTTSSGGTSTSIDVLPPYVITSGTDLDTLLSFNSNAGTSITTATQSVSTDTADTGGESGVTIPINMITLNPILVSYGEFKNNNSQNYQGAHPEEIHGELKDQNDRPRQFRDKLRHCIEVVARGSVTPQDNLYGLNISKNIKKIKAQAQRGIDAYNLDYYRNDLMLKYLTEKTPGIETTDIEMNQRFFGLRAPLVVHGWGYDMQGYPVPNAADEPYELDEKGRAKRFKLKKEASETSTKLKDIKVGESYQLEPGPDVYIYYTKTLNNENAVLINTGDDSDVYKVTIEDNMEDPGAFPNLENVKDLGSIISKTQTWTQNEDGTGKWSEKVKLKEFYLNWGERPDLWPVGPVDLRWDETRKIWVTVSPGGGTSYKLVYVTLEEDLIKEADNYVETYPSRGFLDDVEYSAEPLQNNFRRLVYVKDRAGYTAPKGVKLLCRYDSDTGFYEPVSKPSVITTGVIQDAGNNTANIELSFVQGRKSGLIPTRLITYDNSKFKFNAAQGKTGMFTFIGGKWLLTAMET